MFVRAKKSGAYQYLQLVRSERVDGRVRQQVIAASRRSASSVSPRGLIARNVAGSPTPRSSLLCGARKIAAMRPEVRTMRRN